jgi:Holliday junction DNA helicase RuvA
MVLELRDKLPPAATGNVTALPTKSAIEDDVLSALVNLGYQRPAAERALERSTKMGSGESFETMFREALGVLSK